MAWGGSGSGGRSAIGESSGRNWQTERSISSRRNGQLGKTEGRGQSARVETICQCRWERGGRCGRSGITRWKSKAE